MSSPVYFISDVHLSLSPGPKETVRRKRLFHFLKHVRESRGTLYILGDFFDFWFEYTHVVPMHYIDVLGHIARLIDEGVEVHFVLGNHDFWTQGFLADMGIHVYPAATTVTHQNRRLYLTHGDGLLDGDRGYRLMRRILRSRFMFWAYRWLHPDLGVALAHSFSGLSRHYNSDDRLTRKHFDELYQFARQQWQQENDFVIMGHYHMNRLDHDENGHALLILGDWISHFTYGKLADSRLTLETWPEN